MKNKASVSTKKQSVTVKDLKSKKNPKGGAPILPSHSNILHNSPPMDDCNSTMQGVSTTR